MIQSELSRDHIDTIREVFVYAERFRGVTFVIKIDSGLFGNDSLAALLADIAVLRRAGIHVVIVAGATRRIDQVLDHYGIESNRVDGRRVSPADAIPLIQMAAFDVANLVMTQLSARNINGAIGNWVRARGVGVDAGIDYGHTGEVDRIYTDAIEKLLAADVVPIFPCIGWSATGIPYNVSSDELAAVCARSTGAEKLFFVIDGPTPPDAVLTVPEDVATDEHGRVSRLTVEQAERMRELSSGPTQIPAVRRLNHAIGACRAGVRRVHIVDGRYDGVLLQEIFSNLGAGTMLHANDYESVRPMHADDIPAVLRLLRPFVEKGTILPRSADDIRKQLADYAVSEVDGTVRACCALHKIGDRRGEIAALAVDTRFASL
ncbi:MAG: amino-acid N-acetyltransferase, partial [Spirochaetia bacterium]